MRERNNRTVLLLAAAVVASVLVSVPPVFADAQHLYGIHWWGHSNGSPVDQIPRTLLDVPMYSAWDMEVILANYGPSWWWSADYFASLYSTLYSWNVSVITRIDYTWDECVPAPGDPNYADFPSSFVSNINKLYNYCHIWIVGNEPNLYTAEGSKWPNRKILPVNYAAIYRNVRNAVRASASVGASGKHIVLVAGPSPGGVEGPRWMSGTDWLDQVLASIPPSEVDGIAVHGYAGDINTFRNDIRTQLQVIDNRGCGAKPVWITEFNRYTTDNNDEQHSAQFARDAFTDINTWNQTPGNHNIVGMTWFVYDANQQAGGGWNGYAIEHWKDNGFPAGDSKDLYTAFQQAVDQRYPAGKYGINYPAPWNDDFDDGTVDTSAPEPDWTVETTNGTVQETGGWLKLAGTNGLPGYQKVQNSEYPYYANFVISTKVNLANTTTTTGSGESNAEIRFRTDPAGNGYSLSFKAKDSPTVINLRRSDTWQVIQGKQLSCPLPSGTTLYVRIECNGYRIKVKVGTTPGASNIVNWDFTDTAFTGKGCFWLVNYQMMDCRFDDFKYIPLPCTITGNVRDSRGTAVLGATVTTSPGGYTATVGLGGVYTLSDVVPGTYSITASKAGYTSQTVNNIIATSDTTITQGFTVTDATGPTTPSVMDAGDYQTGSDSLTFSWSSSDPESGIGHYMCAMSTSPSDANIIPGGSWQDVGTATSHTRSGLLLANGMSYYGLVRVWNSIDVEGAMGVSNGIKVAKALPSIAAAKKEPDNVMIALTDRIAAASFADCTYIIDPDGLSGIRLMAGGIPEKALVNLAGFISFSNGERQISGYSISINGE